MKAGQFHSNLHVTVAFRNGFTRGNYLGKQESIGPTLRHLREQNKDYLSQSALAKQLKTTQSRVSQMEDLSYSGTTLTTILKVADALGYDVALSFIQRDQEIDNQQEAKQ